ncbi:MULTISPECIES: hypothetical protein [Streptomyces]|uniref:Uncharacterized protein n=1 Tax=Streptomyces dengpaensis TaxID=2049881 RepID=A0ABM6SYM4_9ACTN|nr:MULTISPECIES: hypothetical protein [Streptomyces]AVH59720.1 hypothetical protein C4B68_32650 [Streptomyces dengpaensis]PIB09364.1 hypothetical protein B1C81_09330 [Streptomyces sp. HG99]
MTSREHITASAGDPAPRRTYPEQTGYVSPTVRQYAETQARLAAEAAEDRYRVPETREQLLAMKSAEQVRTYEQHREVYDRLMGHTT